MRKLASTLPLVSLVPFAIALAGCGDDSETSSGSGGAASSSADATSTTSGPTTSTSGTGTGTNTGTGTDATSGTGGEGGGEPIDPLVAVPPEPLGGDPAAACPAAFTDAAPTDGDNDGFESAGQTRSFFVILPEASFAGPRPLFVGFNGTNETGPEWSERAKLEELAARGFIVVSPSSNGNGTLWPVWDSLHEAGSDDPETNPDLVYFDELVACMGAHFEVDKNRIYVGGHSAGGIMSNYVLQRRSELLAGGIVASGVFSLTSPEPQTDLDDMFVIVTWGGDNDEYSGGSGGVSVPAINFVEQASIASVFYDDEPNVTQAHCRGDDLGHVWLDALDDWFVDALLAHPKGLAEGSPRELPATPDGAPATCSSDPYVFESDVAVDCPDASTVEGCAETCQFIGDCAVENATVGPILAPQLTDLGFSGDDNTECGGCIAHCEEHATTPADDDVLACMVAASTASICGPGIDGALPIIDAFNTCCDGRDDSPWCIDACTILLTNSAASSLLDSCAALVEGG